MSNFEDVTKICPKLVELGFELKPCDRKDHSKDVWLTRPAVDRSGMYEEVIWLQFKPSFHAYSVSFGFANARIYDRLKHFFTSNGAAQLLRNWRNLKRLDLPCWVTFDAGRALDWNHLMIPDPLARETWELEFARLVTVVVEGHLRGVVDDSSYARMLLRSDCPFEWWYGYPVLRAAETALALSYCGENSNSIVDSLNPYARELDKAIGRPCSVPSFVELVLENSALQ